MCVFTLCINMCLGYGRGNVLHVMFYGRKKSIYINVVQEDDITNPLLR